MTWEQISLIANIVLTMLLSFQWFWDRSREHSTKNGLYAVRRMVARMEDVAASNALDAIDAILATLGVRRSFKEWVTYVKSYIRRRKKNDEEEPLEVLPDPRDLHKDLKAVSSRKRDYEKKN